MSSDEAKVRIDRFLREKRKRDKTLILVNERVRREWQCAECGFVKRARTRPNSCPDCNCVNGDMPPGVNLYAPREAIGWFE